MLHSSTNLERRWRKRDGRRRLGPFRGLLVVVVLLAASVGGVAQARRSAGPRERAVILRALHQRTGRIAYPRAWYRERVEISSVRHGTWAVVERLPTRGHEHQVQGDAASLHRIRHRWRVHQIGNGAGCRMPRDVRRDLRLACD